MVRPHKFKKFLVRASLKIILKSLVHEVLLSDFASCILASLFTFGYKYFFSMCLCCIFMTFSLYTTVFTDLIMCHFLCLYTYAQSIFPWGVSTVISVCAFISTCLWKKKKYMSLCLHVYLDVWILCSLFLCLFQYIPLLYDFVLFLIVFLSFILHMAFSIFVFQFSTYVFFYDYKHWSFAVMLCLSTRISWSILLGKHVKDYEQQFIKAIQVG